MSYSKTNTTFLQYLAILRNNINELLAISNIQYGELVINVAISIGVIIFISYQALTLLTNKRSLKMKVDSLTKRDSCNRASGDDSLYTDVHDYILNAKEIPYHPPVFDDDQTMRYSQFFYEQMKARRSVRTFSSRPISMKVIQTLVKTAGTAPSVGNAQPWVYCVITREDIKHSVRKILEDDERINYSTRSGADWVVDVSQLESTWSRPYITDAPYLLVVCHEIFKETNGSKVRALQYNETSTAISVGIFLAAVQKVGLCTVVTSPLNAGTRISKLLRRPDNESVLLLLPIGYPADDATVPDLKKKSVESIIKLY